MVPPYAGREYVPSAVAVDFAAACQEANSLAEIAAIANERDARVEPFGFSLAEVSSYPSLDVVLPHQESARRVLVHPVVPPEKLEAGEAILEAAGLRYFPAIATSPTHEFREVPLYTIPLLNHNLSRPAADTVSRQLLAPALRRLFIARGVVPVELTFDGLVHIEEPSNPRQPGRLIETGLAFTPPYEFEFVDSDTFVVTAVRNARHYGDRLQDSLRQNLTAA